MEEVLFEDAFNLKQGNHLAINDLHADGFDVFGANGIVGKFDKFMYEDPTVLVTCRGATCGSINLTTPKSWVTGNAIALVPKIKVDTKYIYYQLKGTGFKDVISGSAQPQIIVSTLSRKKFKLLPFEEQIKIASILEQVDGARQKRKQANRLTEQFLQSVFLEMFGDPVENAKEWDKEILDKVVKNENSKRVPVKQSDRDKRDGIYPYYGATGIIDTIDDYKFDGEYLLIAEDGKNLLLRRKDNAYMARGKFWVNNHAHVLSFNGKANLLFLMYFLNQTDLKPFVTGIDQFKLNKDNLDRIPIFLPPLPLQKKFANLVEQVDKLRLMQSESEKELENLFQSLLQKYFGS